MMKFRGAPRVSRLLYESKDNISLARSLTGLIHDDKLPNDIDACLRKKPSMDEVTDALFTMGFDEALAQRVAKRTCVYDEQSGR
jgi:hypothetical protein